MNSIGVQDKDLIFMSNRLSFAHMLHRDRILMKICKIICSKRVEIPHWSNMYSLNYCILNLKGNIYYQNLQ